MTVESLSRHRVCSTDEHEVPERDLSPEELDRQDDYAEQLIDYLRKTPIKTGDRNTRIRLQNVQTVARCWINASTEYTDQDDRTRRVVISIVPAHGTVGPSQIKKPVRGNGHDAMIICGFAFDPHVSEEAKRYGMLTVLPTRMNPDLVMGDELLKKTGAGNLFMVFGEPDVDVSTCDDGKLVASIKRVDVYDPTTGTVRSDSPDEIACWFIDTDYNEESFFVRHAYFTGADEPYKRLQRAPRAEIDEDAWASLYRTESRPFDRPDTGKIAVKVINHYGDEVMKVFEVCRPSSVARSFSGRGGISRGRWPEVMRRRFPIPSGPSALER